MPSVFRALDRGRIRVQLTPQEAEVLRSLPGELKEVLEVESPEVMERLFPPAYLENEDVEREREYRSLMRDGSSPRASWAPFISNCFGPSSDLGTTCFGAAFACRVHDRR